MGTSICIACVKGGVGKSTIAVNLGIALSNVGVNSIVVDGDLQGACIGSLIGSKLSIPSIHDCLSGIVDVKDAIIHLNGANFIVGGIEIEKLRNINRNLFKDIINKLTDKFEFVIVDCPPGLGGNAVAAISSCKALILIVTPDIASMSNALKTKVVAEKTGCLIIGTIVNRASSEYDMPDAQVSNVLGVEVIGRLPEDKEMKKALTRGKPLIWLNPESPFSLELMKFASKFKGI